MYHSLCELDKRKNVPCKKDVQTMVSIQKQPNNRKLSFDEF